MNRTAEVAIAVSNNEVVEPMRSDLAGELVGFAVRRVGTARGRALAILQIVDPLLGVAFQLIEGLSGTQPSAMDESALHS